MRCSPHAGVHCTFLMSRSVPARSPLAVHADEPLRRGAEDQRRLVAPAMRIAVRIRCLVHQPAALFQLGDDHGSCGIDPKACDQLGLRGKAAVGPDRVDHRQAVALADRRSPPGRARARYARRRCRPRASRARPGSPAPAWRARDARAAGPRAPRRCSGRGSGLPGRNAPGRPAPVQRRAPGFPHRASPGRARSRTQIPLGPPPPRSPAASRASWSR